MENLILLKGLKRPNTKSSKIACLSKTFFCKFTQATSGACIHLTSSAWSFGLKKLSEFGCKMGGIFIVTDVTVRAYLQIRNINIRGTGPWETDWISITGVQR